jgi:H+/Cl- antiporter ClcA
MQEFQKIALSTKIRRRLKSIFDRAPNETLKLNFLRAVPFWIASLLTGLIAVFYSRVFLLAESGAGALFRSYNWSLFIVTPSCFLMAWWLVVRFEKFAGGSGIPQVMAAIELANPRDHLKVRKLLSIRVIVIKISESIPAGLVAQDFQKKYDYDRCRCRTCRRVQHAPGRNRFCN